MTVRQRWLLRIGLPLIVTTTRLLLTAVNNRRVALGDGFFVTAAIPRRLSAASATRRGASVGGDAHATAHGIAAPNVAVAVRGDAAATTKFVSVAAGRQAVAGAVPSAQRHPRQASSVIRTTGCTTSVPMRRTSAAAAATAAAAAGSMRAAACEPVRRADRLQRGDEVVVRKLRALVRSAFQGGAKLVPVRTNTVHFCVQPDAEDGMSSVHLRQLPHAACRLVIAGCRFMMSPFQNENSEESGQLNWSQSLSSGGTGVPLTSGCAMNLGGHCRALMLSYCEVRRFLGQLLEVAATEAAPAAAPARNVPHRCA